MGESAVTVIIPAYNGIGFLGAALASVREQTKQPMQVIVVDAGSTDGTPELVAQLASVYPAIRLVSSEGRLSAPQARNVALGLVETPLVATLDQDDLMVPSRLERQTVALRQSPGLVALGGRLQPIDTAGLPMPRTEGVRHRSFPVSAEQVRWTLTTAMPTYSSSLTYRTDLLRRAGGFDESHPLTDDYGLLIQLAEEGAVALLDTVVGYYRRHREQSSRSARQRQAMESNLIAWRLIRERLGSAPSAALLGCLAKPSACSDAALLAEASALVRALLSDTITSRRLDPSDADWITRDADVLLGKIDDATAAAVVAGQ